MSDHERPCGCLFKGYEVVSQCIYHTGRQNLIDSLQREIEDRVKAHNEIFDAFQKCQQEKEELTRKLDEARAAAITPEMRERMRKALQIIEEHNITTSIYAETDAGVIFRDLLGEQG